MKTSIHNSGLHPSMHSGFKEGEFEIVTASVQNARAAASNAPLAIQAAWPTAQNSTTGFLGSPAINFTSYGIFESLHRDPGEKAKTPVATTAKPALVATEATNLPIPPDERKQSEQTIGNSWGSIPQSVPLFV